jgi:hypothetical protein
MREIVPPSAHGTGASTLKARFFPFQEVSDPIREVSVDPKIGRTL